jgi:hypothetical protein
MDQSTMTHYMQLLASNQPWNLIFFMAIPVIFAETLTVTEFMVIFGNLTGGFIRKLNKFCGIFVGIYFTGVFLYLVTTVVPTIVWRGAVDFLAVWFYLSGVLFLGGIALLDMGLIGKEKNEQEKKKLHFILISGFLVVAHIAMILGMVNPQIFTGVTMPMK